MAKKIMIIEDDADVRMGYQIRLRASGYETSCAADATSSMMEVRRSKPDLIMLDLGLPGGDGFVVLDRLRVNTQLSAIPVVVVSGRNVHTNRQRALSAGASAFFQKPVDNGELLHTIRALVGG